MPNTKLISGCLMFLTAVAITVALIFTKSVMLPFIFSIFLYVVASPRVNWLQIKLKLPRVVAVGVTFIVFISIFSGLSILIASSIDEFIQSADEYKQKITAFINWLGSVLDSYGYEINVEKVRELINQMPLVTWTKSLTGSVLSFVGNLSLVTIFFLFLIISDQRDSSAPKLLEKIKLKISKYVSTKALLSLATGFLAWLILELFNVELAFMFGVLTFLLNFIPNIGSIIATFLPVPVVLLQYGFGIKVVVILSLLGATQLIIGNILEPKIMGESLDLSPITILIFLMFWGLVWGVAGMFLAVPITATLKIIFEQIDETKSLAALMAGRLSD